MSAYSSSLAHELFMNTYVVVVGHRYYYIDIYMYCRNLVFTSEVHWYAASFPIVLLVA